MTHCLFSHPRLVGIGVTLRDVFLCVHTKSKATIRPSESVLKQTGGGGSLLRTTTFLSAGSFSTMAEITSTVSRAEASEKFMGSPYHPEVNKAFGCDIRYFIILVVILYFILYYSILKWQQSLSPPCCCSIWTSESDC